MFLTLYCHFNFITSLFVLSGYIPFSAFNIVLLIVLEHPSTFFAAVVFTVPSCSANCAFPSPVLLHSRIGTITFIRMNIWILLRCVHSKSIIMRSLRQSTCTGLRSVFIFSPLAFEGYRAHLIVVTYSCYCIFVLTFAVALHFLGYATVVSSLLVSVFPHRCFWYSHEIIRKQTPIPTLYPPPPSCFAASTATTYHVLSI